MGLINEEIEVGIGSKTDQYYESKGYQIPRRIIPNKTKPTTIRGGFMKVWTKDLHPESCKYVNIYCDCCGSIYSTRFNRYLKALDRYDKNTLCEKCAHIISKLLVKGYSVRDAINLYKNPNIEYNYVGNRNIPGYKAFVFSVLNRDDFTCQKCGDQSCLQIHHINSYNWCIEGRTDVTNGITLCKDCHKDFHRVYGYGYNTREEFQIWFGKNIDMKDYKYEKVEKPKRKSIYCFEDDTIYNSVKDLKNALNLKEGSHIYATCNHRSGYTTLKGKHYFWLDEYEKLSEEDIDKYIHPPNRKPIEAIERNKIKVICLDDNKIFESTVEAGNYYGVWPAQISGCCTHKTAHVLIGQDKIPFHFAKLSEYQDSVA